MNVRERILQQKEFLDKVEMLRRQGGMIPPLFEPLYKKARDYIDELSREEIIQAIEKLALTRHAFFNFFE